MFFSKWVLQPSLLSAEKGESWAPSSCSSTRLWPFHVDDGFRCGVEGEEGSGFGLRPLITLYYHTGGIYHQTPKASVHGGTLKPISSLTCNPSSSTKSSIVERHHIHFLCKRGMFQRKSKRQRTEREGGGLERLWDKSFQSPWDIFSYLIRCHSPVCA